MLKRIISLLTFAVLMCSLCACNKKEEPLPAPSEAAPIAKEEPEDAPPVKEFSDGRLYTDGDIISFCETENYYFILDVQDGFKYISCFTKDGQLIKRDKPMGEKGGQEIYFYPETDIYPVKNDCVIFCCISENISKCIIVDKNIETSVITTDNVPNLRSFGAAFLDNGEGYYDILTLDDNGLLYRFVEDRMTTVQNGEYFSFSDLSPRHFSEPRTAFKTEDGSVYTSGLIAEPFYDEYFQDKAVIAKFSDTGEMLASKVCSFGYDPIMEAKEVGNYIVFAQAVFDLKTAIYTNRLFVLDKNLNEVFTKDYLGELPVEVVAFGDKLAVSLYVDDGSKYSSVQILDGNGEEATRINHFLMFSRLFSDNNGGFYITGKQGVGFKDPVNTVICRYNENIELVKETIYETKEDEDKGFGMFIEINSAGEPIALQGKISSFPIRAIDKSPPRNAFYNYENSFDTETVPEQPVQLNSSAPADGAPLGCERDVADYLTAGNKHFILVGDLTPERYLYCYNTNGEGLWKVKVTVGGKLYYVNGCIMVHRGDILAAYNVDTGENLWTMHLEWTTETVSAAVLDDKLYIIRNLDEEYSVCKIDSEGNWEYMPLPEQRYGVPDGLITDPVTGELYCSFRDGDIITLGRLNNNFEVIGYHTFGDFKTMSFVYTINNGAVYVNERDRFEELTDAPFYLKVFDSELNLIKTLDYNTKFVLLGSAGKVGTAIKATVTEENADKTQNKPRPQTFIIDNNGNIINALTHTGEAKRVFATDTGVSVVAGINDDNFKIYDYDENLKLTNVSIYTKTTDDFIEYFIHNGVLILD